MTSCPQGLGEGWDPYWGKLDPRMVSLYTTGRPRNIHQFWQRCYAEDLRGLMGNMQGTDCLELGAGRGTTSMYVTSYGGKVTMLDLSGAGLAIAKANFAREKLEQPTMIRADARNTHLPSESYDCVYSIGLLEHFDNPQPILMEAERLLRPGGLHFAVIVAGRGDEVRTFVYAFLRPLSFAWKLVPQSIRKALRPPRPPSDPAEKDEYRNNIMRSEYLEMLGDVTDSACVPYNPYHSAYNSDFLEEYITVPLYRLHRALKKRFARFPLLKTWPRVASCDLLVFRKAL